MARVDKNGRRDREKQRREGIVWFDCLLVVVVVSNGRNGGMTTDQEG